MRRLAPDCAPLELHLSDCDLQKGLDDFGCVASDFVGCLICFDFMIFKTNPGHFCPQGAVTSEGFGSLCGALEELQRWPMLVVAIVATCFGTGDPIVSKGQQSESHHGDTTLPPPGE